MKDYINAKTVVSTLLASGILLGSVNVASADINNAYQSIQNDFESSELIAFSEAELAQLLAPIALYPDSLLAHILVAASYPLDIVKAHRLVQDNPGLSAQRLMQEGEDLNWEPSIVALLGFLDVLAQMHDELDWTISLGTAFIGDERAVLASVQGLRQDAQAANSLGNLAHMKVTTVNNHIYIAPRTPQRIYVPVYHPQYVYGNWRYRSHKPFAWNKTLRLNLSPAVRIAWGSRVGINFDFFFGGFNWVNRHTVFTHPRGSKRYISPYKFARNKHAKHYRFSEKRLRQSHQSVYVKHTGKHKRYAVIHNNRSAKHRVVDYRKKHHKNTRQFEYSSNNPSRDRQGFDRLIRTKALNKRSQTSSNEPQRRFVQEKNRQQSKQHYAKTNHQSHARWERQKTMANQQRKADTYQAKKRPLAQKPGFTDKRIKHKGAVKQASTKRFESYQQGLSKQKKSARTKDASGGKDKKLQ